MAAPQPERLEKAVALFQVALREARRVAEAGDGDSTQPSLWGRPEADPREC
jgi:hypothetical protein